MHVPIPETLNHWKRRVAQEGLVRVRAGAAMEDGAPSRRLFGVESTLRAEADPGFVGIRAVVLITHPNSLQFADHV